MNIKIKHFSVRIAIAAVLLVAAAAILFSGSSAVYAQTDEQKQQIQKEQRERAKKREKAQSDNFFGSADKKDDPQCGKGPNAVKTRINFGCLGNSAKTNISPVEDLMYAVIRFLSYGVGIVLIGSMIWAGIQYSTSEGNPEATQSAKNRIRDAVIGLFVYLFAFALVQYLVPGGIFN